MPSKKQDTAPFEALKAAVAAGNPETLYVFHGEERYLLEAYLEKIRKLLVSGDFAEFNYRRYDGGSLSVDELAAAVDTVPAFSDRTLIEVHDFDISSPNEDIRKKLAALFSDLPGYVCLIFVNGDITDEKSGEPKIAKEIKKAANVVGFNIQDQSKLIKWIKDHFAANSRSVDTPTAEYMAMLTGGSMTTMNAEIDKVSAFTPDRVVTRAHMDAVVTPQLDAVVWRLTDHIAAGTFGAAAGVLSDLLSLNEKPHVIIFNITMKLRQLLTARCCLDAGLGEKDLMKMAGMKWEFQARNAFASARKMSVPECRRAVLISAEAALRMNSGADYEDCLTELLLGLAMSRRTARAR